MDLTSVSEWLGERFGMAPTYQEKVFLSLLIVAVLWLLRQLVLLVANRRIEDIRVQYRWKKTSSYVAAGIGLLLVGRVWFEGVDSEATYLGLLSAGIAIALKDPLVNLAGWGFILWRRPFEVGDRIQVGALAGDVIDVRLFQFTLLEIGNWVHADQSTGRIINVPNGRVFSEPVANSARGFRFLWNEIPVLVTFESDWRKAKELLQGIAMKHSQHVSAKAEEQVRMAAKRYMILYSHLTPKIYTSVRDSGVLLTVRYICDARQRRGTTEAIWEEVLDAFEEAGDIDFAYPTQRFYEHRTEGKPALRPQGD